MIAADVITSKKMSLGNDPAVDSFIYESGSVDVDGYTAASVKAHVAIVKSDYSGLSFSAPVTANLATAQIREMVLKAITLDKHYGTGMAELKYKINAKGATPWVSIMPNVVQYPGNKWMPGDQTDPRIIGAVLDYIADSTHAQRITLLMGGTCALTPDSNAVWMQSVFGTARWNHYWPDLDSTFRLQALVDSAKARNPGKTICWINTNYNEILTGGAAYNELTLAERVGKVPEYYDVPTGNYGIGALTTSNTLSDNGKYNPTAAVKNCDFLVNIPLIKTTYDVVLNGAFKNYIGSVSRGVYSVSDGGYPQARTGSLNALDHDALCKTVINLFSLHPSDYIIVDGTAGLEGEGSHPWSTRTGFLKRNFVMAGGDPIAVEAVMAATFNLNPNDLEQCRWGQAKGYGIAQLQNIALYGTPLANVQTDVLAPIGGEGIKTFAGFATHHYTGRGCRRWLLNGPYTAANNAAAHIDEANADPRPGDVVNSLAWTPYYSKTNAVDLTQALAGTTAGSVAYAYTQIYSDKNQSGLLYIGGVYNIRVYVNGVTMLDSAFSDYSDVNAVLPVSLVNGDNRILVKVRRNASAGAFQFSLATVNDGALSPRNSFLPYAAGNATVATSATAMTTDQKKAFFGGRTLFGTFYHLGQSNPDAIESGKVHAGRAPLLAQSEPNPFTVSTRIRFSLPMDAPPADLSIYDLSGKKVITLFTGNPGGRRYTASWNGRNTAGQRVASGVYLCRLASGNRMMTRKILFAR
ncbi:MAG: DUF362 domain-containing protein [Fibrobacterota bacterium]